ncbi:MAG: hypothetical protein CVT73_01040 [Alphaproteobacteria bacterium HGW-Alphaproteobacteria-12]|nr:MAG: hypothetical protein CVT73_01040 [Alphaproteobacteria bacterium HGW-Alphaproteobacteria-12]
MRFRLLSLSVLFLPAVLAAAAPPCAASPSTETPAAREPVPRNSTGDARNALLGKLFAQLAAAKTEEEGRALERAIQSIWLASGSPSIDLLMSRGLDALGEQNFERAYFYFDEVVTLAPGFAEGWNKRAAIQYIREDYAAALHDLEQALRLEPRHYEAIAGLGVILEELGDKKGALEAYRRALALDPWLRDGKIRIAPLELEVEGRGI